MSTERDIIIERLEQKLAARDREFEQMMEMNKSLRDSVLEQQNTRSDNHKEVEERISRLERRLVELNSSYDGVMKELLDQKSIIQEMRSKDELMSPKHRINDKQKEESKSREEAKQPEKTKPKGEYIVADNYVPRDKRKQQIIIEAEDKAEDKSKTSEKAEQKPVFNKPVTKRSERVGEGVEIYETPKRGR